MAKKIMIQGTSSGVGKSIFTMGLCRLLKNEGYKVAPFKAQNISSNIYTLENNMQMAKSQALAAIACELEPDPIMNPVLLELGIKNSNLILNGKKIGSANAFRSNEIKENLKVGIIESYNKLDKLYDIIVIEGAGSPVEMNLKENDIVNMSFAKKINTPVLLVSDIDRGGIFASIYGTVSLFDEQEKNLLKGIIINRFKGIKSSFDDGKKIIENLTKTPVIGILPYMNIKIEDEDDLQVGSHKKTEESIIEENNLSKNGYKNHLLKEFDLLAESFKENLDINLLYQIIENGV